MILDTVKNATHLRTGLAERYPAFAPGKLSDMVIVGAAEEGERLCAIAEETGINVQAVIDSDPSKTGRRIGRHHEVQPALPEDLDPRVPIVVASHRVLGATKHFRQNGHEDIIGFGVLQTIDPERFPPQMFYENWLEDIVTNSDQYRRVHDLLADATSRSIFEAILEYRITGNIMALDPWVDDTMFYPSDLFSFGTDEVYIDAGAYTGDTISNFVEHTDGKFERILGFEPDILNFQQLEKNFANEPRISTIEAGLYSERKALRFSSDAGRASGLSEDGNVEIQVTTIDGELDGQRVTYIKLNIEGAELEALKGARKSIEKWVPRLGISGYHFASHLWEVPLLIKELQCSYDLYLRQHDGGVIESTFYGLTPDHRV